MPTNPTEQFEALRDDLDALDPESEDFASVFEQIRQLAEAGVLQAADLVAEISAFDPRLRDPRLAYKFYNIAKKAEGFSVTFNNISDDPEQYLGVVGDFRNEAQVSDLVVELGFSDCQSLDREADDWRSRHSGS